MVQEQYVYVLRCGDGSLYTGWTNDIFRRVKAHQSGAGAKYTKSHQPVSLVYYETFATKQEAMRREAWIKKLPRQKKVALIEGRRPEDEDWEILSTWRQTEG